jgi:hypothetical protein
MFRPCQYWRRSAALCLAAAAVLIGGAGRPEALLVHADAPVPVLINGRPATLALSTGSVDHVTLNVEAVRRLQIRLEARGYDAHLNMGGVRVLTGRHGGGWLRVGERRAAQKVHWFDGASPLPRDGTIGPLAFPHRQVTVNLRQGIGRVITLPLAGSIDSCGYGLVAGPGYGFGLAVDVRTRRSLPLVSAATGADLASALGGRLEGEPWEEEIVMGLRRPVRKLVLQRPLMIGHLRIDAVAMRVGGRRDTVSLLAEGQRAVRDANADPEEMVVIGRTALSRQVARVLHLSRTQLDELGCVNISYDKRARQMALAC